MFPSIPIPEALTAFENWLSSLDIDIGTINIYVEVASLCMRHTFFQFRDCYYKQTHGTSMGNPLSPLIAELFMSKLEINLSSNNMLPSFWKRYVDDVLVIINKNEEEKTLQILNNQNPAIKFTLERELNGSIPFLDLLLTRKNNSINIEVFHKSTNTCRLITHDSHCSYQIKMSSFHSMVHRLCKLPLSIANYMKEYQYIKHLAVVNGYSPKIIDEIVRHHTHKIRLNNLTTHFTQNRNSSPNKKRVKCTYSPTITNKLKTIFGKHNITLSFGNNNKIQQILGSTRQNR